MRLFPAEKFRIIVAARDAKYPVTIDPTIIDDGLGSNKSQYAGCGR